MWPIEQSQPNGSKPTTTKTSVQILSTILCIMHISVKADWTVDKSVTMQWLLLLRI